MGVDSKLVLKGIILLVRPLAASLLLSSFTWTVLSFRLGRQVHNDSTVWLMSLSPPPPQIVDKALEEPKYSSLYAQLCLRLAEDAPNFDGSSSEIQSSQKQSTVSVAPPARHRAAPLKAQRSFRVLFLSSPAILCSAVRGSLFLRNAHVVVSLFADLQKTADFQTSR